MTAPRNQAVLSKIGSRPYPLNQWHFVKENGVQLHYFRCVVYIDWSLNITSQTAIIKRKADKTPIPCTFDITFFFF